MEIQCNKNGREQIQDQRGISMRILLMFWCEVILSNKYWVCHWWFSSVLFLSHYKIKSLEAGNDQMTKLPCKYQWIWIILSAQGTLKLVNIPSPSRQLGSHRRVQNWPVATVRCMGKSTKFHISAFCHKTYTDYLPVW